MEFAPRSLVWPGLMYMVLVTCINACILLQITTHVTAVTRSAFVPLGLLKAVTIASIEIWTGATSFSGTPLLLTGHVTQIAQSRFVPNIYTGLLETDWRIWHENSRSLGIFSRTIFREISVCERKLFRCLKVSLCLLCGLRTVGGGVSASVWRWPASAGPPQNDTWSQVVFLKIPSHFPWDHSYQNRPLKTKIFRVFLTASWCLPMSKTNV